MANRNGYNPSNDDLIDSIYTKIDMLFNHLDALGDPSHPAIGLDEDDPRSRAVYRLRTEIKHDWVVFIREIHT